MNNVKEGVPRYQPKTYTMGTLQIEMIEQKRSWGEKSHLLSDPTAVSLAVQDKIVHAGDVSVVLSLRDYKDLSTRPVSRDNKDEARTALIEFRDSLNAHFEDESSFAEIFEKVKRQLRAARTEGVRQGEIEKYRIEAMPKLECT